MKQKKEKLAPIALFCFDRLEHLKQCVSSLRSSSYANSSELFVFSDAAKDNRQIKNVLKVRKYIKTIKGFRRVTVIERKKNKGLAESITSGVTEILNQYDSIIVIEDDLVVNKDFLLYMNFFLEKYREQESIISVHGYLFPLKEKLQDNFFIAGADCWGWGTWRRGWHIFNPDGKKLLQELNKKNLLWKFDYEGTANYEEMLKNNIAGLNDSWAIRWHASALINNKLTLYPRDTLVINTGNDGSGIHSIKSKFYDVSFSKRVFSTSLIEIKESKYARYLIRDYFMRQQNRGFFSLLKRTYKWIKYEIKRIGKTVPTE